mgnify:CR=1 FL=1
MPDERAALIWTNMTGPVRPDGLLRDTKIEYIIHAHELCALGSQFEYYSPRNVCADPWMG